MRGSRASTRSSSDPSGSPPALEARFRAERAGLGALSRAATRLQAAGHVVGPQRQARGDAAQEAAAAHRRVEERPARGRALRPDRPQDLRTSSPQDLRSSRPQDLRSSSPQDLKTSRPQDLRTPRPQDLRSSRPQDLKSSRPQDLRTSRPQAPDTPLMRIGIDLGGTKIEAVAMDAEGVGARPAARRHAAARLRRDASRRSRGSSPRSSSASADRRRSVSACRASSPPPPAW